jgi:hypothetical protein
MFLRLPSVAAIPNRRFKLHTHRQFFIGPDGESLSVVAMCVRNPDRSSVNINL